jgi:DNA modification methylase
MIQAKEIQLVDIDSLVLNPKNNNKHPKEQIERLAKLIQYQGFRNPVVVSKRTGFVLAGHGRIEAAKIAGLKEVPAMFQDFDNEAQEYAYLTSDNAIAAWAELDLSAVNTEMLDLGPDFDIDLLGIKDFVIEPIEKFEPQSDEDDVPDVVHPITRKGDIWLLGNHRLMCGDSTMIDDVEKLMNGEKADMVFTDPPYGMKLDADYSKMGSGGIKHDNIIGDHEDFRPELIQTIFGMFGYCKEIFIFGADYFAELLENKNQGSWIVWDKRSDKEKIALLDGQFGSSFELCWSKNKHKREICRELGPRGFYESDKNEKQVHPTQKPTRVVLWFFEKWAKNLNLIIDLFLGSGSTLIACEKTNRKCYGMELDEKYCDVIINRWQNYTGKKATLELTGQTYEELKVERDG